MFLNNKRSVSFFSCRSFTICCQFQWFVSQLHHRKHGVCHTTLWVLREMLPCHTMWFLFKMNTQQMNKTSYCEPAHVFWEQALTQRQSNTKYVHWKPHMWTVYRLSYHCAKSAEKKGQMYSTWSQWTVL